MKTLTVIRPLAIALAFLLLLAGVELGVSLALTHGTFVYALDDPYIHLALAENIVHGHYGVNTAEYSSASSSILWPFLLAPLARFEIFPFVLNLAFAVATVAVYARVGALALRRDQTPADNKAVTVVMLLLVLSTNLVGLIFTGMEHSLQVLFTTLTAYGLIREAETGRLAAWLPAVIILGPLVRYESLAISVAAILYLALTRHWLVALLCTAAVTLSLGGFSLFLVFLGLPPLPCSVYCKSDVVREAGTVQTILEHLSRNVQEPVALYLGIALVTLAIILFRSQGKRRLLAALSILAVAMHFACGRFGWSNRYEIYIWTFVLLVNLYLYGPLLATWLGSSPKGYGWRLTKLALVGLALCIHYIYGLVCLPVSIANIHGQQYQMHRFLVDYYSRPAAVNDLGYVSYKNDRFILDLWGLGSAEALRHRRQGDSMAWMAQMMEERGVDLAMVYDPWYVALPERWIKIGELVHEGLPLPKLYDARISFYANDPEALAGIEEALGPFIQTLPPGVRFRYADGRGHRPYAKPE